MSAILWTLLTVLQHIHGIGPCPAALYRIGCARAVVARYTNEIERDATGEGSMSMSFANRSRENTHPELKKGSMMKLTNNDLSGVSQTFGGLGGQ